MQRQKYENKAVSKPCSFSESNQGCMAFHMTYYMHKDFLLWKNKYLHEKYRCKKNIISNYGLNDFLKFNVFHVLNVFHMLKVFYRLNVFYGLNVFENLNLIHSFVVT